MSLVNQYPDGCFIGFNAAIDRRASEQFASIFANAVSNGFKEVSLCISSIGGILDHAYYLCNVIDAFDVKVITYNVGNIQSSANLLFLCGDERYASTGATFFFHQTGFDPPNTRITDDYVRDRIKAIEYDDARTAQYIAGKTGATTQAVREWQKSEKLMTTEEAISHNIISSVRDMRIPPRALFTQVII